MCADKKIIDNIRSLGIDMIREANSGHSGIVLGAAPMIYTLFRKHLVFPTNVCDYVNRDRFVMSAGHGSALLYSTMFFSGYPIKLEDLKKFRKKGSITPGHPEVKITKGIEVSTGPLGQGVATSVGIAIAEKFLREKFALNKHESLISHYTYCLCGDGDLMEGVSNEALSLAGKLKLGKLILLYDSNDVCLDSFLAKTMTDNTKLKYEALGFHVIVVNDGESVKAIDKAICKAKNVSDKPSLIIVKTKIGKYSSMENSNKVHGCVLSESEIASIKKKMDIRNIPFIVSNEAREAMKKDLDARSNASFDNYDKLLLKFYKSADVKLINEFELYMQNKLPEIDFDNVYEKYKNIENLETRVINGEIMNYIAKNDPFFIGGSADLSSSTKTYLKDFDDYNEVTSGRNIFYGVRENAMASISNGLALCNLRCFASTFLVFSDYMKPGVRMSALMDLPVSYVFTHDSVTVGEDGPTHQPIEQLAMLRSIPNLNVYRPCDINEIIATWKDIYLRNKPSCVVISRNEKGSFLQSSLTIEKGAYIIRKESSRIDGIIIATGSEVAMCVKIAEELYESELLDIRVVSMPCVENFLAQTDSYKEKIIPAHSKVIVVEAASSFGWHRFVYSDKYLITIDDFGISAGKEDVLKNFKFDHANIKKRVTKILK